MRAIQAEQHAMGTAEHYLLYDKAPLGLTEDLARPGRRAKGAAC